MKEWVIQEWKPACDDNMLLLDEHKAQKTEEIKSCLEVQCGTQQVFVPAGITYLVQTLDVVFNQPFKAATETQATSTYKKISMLM